MSAGRPSRSSFRTRRSRARWTWQGAASPAPQSPPTASCRRRERRPPRRPDARGRRWRTRRQPLPEVQTPRTAATAIQTHEREFDDRDERLRRLISVLRRAPLASCASALCGLLRQARISSCVTITKSSPTASRRDCVLSGTNTRQSSHTANSSGAPDVFSSTILAARWRFFNPTAPSLVGYSVLDHPLPLLGSRRRPMHRFPPRPISRLTVRSRAEERAPIRPSS